MLPPSRNEMLRSPLLRDYVEEGIRDGKSTIVIKPEKRSLSRTILAQPLRGYYIAKKAIFLSAVVAYAKILPPPLATNTSGAWTKPFMEVLDKLVEYAQYRQSFFIAARKIVLNEIEHDVLYRDPMLALIEWLIEKVLDGEILPRVEGKPDKIYWAEPSPYGGEHSIIHKIREHREEIKAILGIAVDGDESIK